MLIRRYVVLALFVGLICSPVLFGADLTLKERLGKELFFDKNLSSPPNMSCATCHAPEVGFTGPNSRINRTIAVYPGAVHTRFGNRKPPTAAYGGDSPVLYFDDEEGLWLGGMFWDGRATGWRLGDPLAEQAQGPFLNPVEQNMPDKKAVCTKVARSSYAGLFKKVWGKDSLRFSTPAEVDLMYDQIAFSIAAFERSPEVNPFSSKYDRYLTGVEELTEEEAWGLELFNGKGMCAACHPSEVGPNGEPPLFTDFSYDNLGVPKNPQNPFYTMPPEFNPDGKDWIDPGLGGFLKGAGFGPEWYEPEWGKHKVPTLRNVDKRPTPNFVKAYGHNGFFKSLKEIVHFYNTRDVEDWPAPEVAENINTDELGDLGLSDAEEDAIVDFLKTLSDK